jgi:hypothetical protein
MSVYVSKYRLPESWNYLCHQGFVDIRNLKTSKWVIDVLTHPNINSGLSMWWHLPPILPTAIGGSA